MVSWSALGLADGLAIFAFSEPRCHQVVKASATLALGSRRRVCFRRVGWTTPRPLAMRHREIFPVLGLVVACATSETRSTDSTAVTPASLGEARLPVEGGNIWYSVTGNPSAPLVVLLHGGPGYASFYLKPMEALGDEFAVVRYDQLGSGKSDHPGDTSLYNIPRFVRELESLRAALGRDQVHLVGHSWGTILAYEYYQAHANHVASLTFMSACLDVGTWERNANALVKTLSDSSQRAIGAAIASRRWDSKGFEAANGEFMSKYVFLQPPRQPDWDSTMTTAGMDQYMYMWGPSEFATTGTLGGYSALGGLAGIKVPTLFTVGSDDEADTTTIKAHAAMVPGARVAIIPNAAHLTMWDNPDESLRVVREFLRLVSR